MKEILNNFRKYFYNARVICLITLALIAFWSINAAFLPLLVLSLISLIIFIFSKNQESIKLEFPDLILILIVIYELFSFYFSTYKPNSHYYLVKLFLFLILYYNLSFLKDKDRKILMLIITAYFFIISVIILLQFIKHYFLISNYSFSDLTPFRFLFFPFWIIPNDWVTIQIFMLSFPLILYFQSVSDKIEKIPSEKPIDFFQWRIVPFKLYMFSLAVTINLILFNIIVLFSRGGYIALFSILLMTFVLLYFYSGISPKSKIIKYLFFLIIFPTIAIIPFKNSISSTLHLSDSIIQERSISGRLNIWKSSFEIFKEKPIVGIGSNNFALKYNSNHSNNEDFSFSGRISNSFFQVLVEKGILGSIIYFSIFCIFVYFGCKILILRSMSNKNTIFLIVFFSILFGISIRETTSSTVFFANNICFIFCFLAVMYNNLIFNNESYVLKKWINKLLAIILLLGLSYITFDFSKKQNVENYFDKYLTDYSNDDLQNALVEIEKICDIEKMNAYYLSHKALTYAKLGNFRWDSNLSNMVSPYPNVQELITSYKKVIAINPNDDNYYHNLGWLYFINGKSDSALLYINKAKTIEPNCCLYHISSGMVHEYRKEIDSALFEYSYALKVSPDLTESKFWKEFKNRFPVKADSILNSVVIQLESRVQMRNPVYLSRLAKLYINKNNLKIAKEILIKITNDIPILSRPWYNLGYLYELDNDSKKMMKCYKNSLLIDHTNYLPYLHLAVSYDRMGRKREALNNYINGMICWKHLISEHSQRCNRIYFIKGVEDDIIPYGLLSYIKPDIDYEQIITRIKELESTF